MPGHCFAAQNDSWRSHRRGTAKEPLHRAAADHLDPEEVQPSRGEMSKWESHLPMVLPPRYSQQSMATTVVDDPQIDRTTSYNFNFMLNGHHAAISWCDSMGFFIPLQPLPAEGLQTSWRLELGEHPVFGSVEHLTPGMFTCSVADHFFLGCPTHMFQINFRESDNEPRRQPEITRRWKGQRPCCYTSLQTLAPKIHGHVFFIPLFEWLLHEPIQPSMLNYGPVITLKHLFLSKIWAEQVIPQCDS